LEGEWEEEDNWYSLDQVPTTSHLVKTTKNGMTNEERHEERHEERDEETRHP
jgi:hypothetical protein